MTELSDEEYKNRCSHLLQLKTEMPEIWHMITQTRCCPSHIGLTDHCSLTKGYQCEECWSKNLPNTDP